MNPKISDDWFWQTDSEELLRARNEEMVVAYYWREHLLEHSYAMLHVFSRRYASQALEDYQFGPDVFYSKGKFVRTRRNNTAVLARRLNARKTILLKATPEATVWGDSAGYERVRIEKSQEETGGQAFMVRISRDWIEEDLEKRKLAAILCFNCYRYSERTLKELQMEPLHSVESDESMVFLREISSRADKRFRMRSRSLLMGKARDFA